jgi:Bacterial Ig-like domain (group 2)
MSKPLAEELTEFQTTLDLVRKQYSEDGTITRDEQTHLDVLEGKIKQLLTAASRQNAGNANGQSLAAPGAGGALSAPDVINSQGAVMAGPDDSKGGGTGGEIGGGSGGTSGPPTEGKPPTVGGGNVAGSGDKGKLVTVGRWMSREEYEAIKRTGKVQERGGGSTNVIYPPTPSGYKNPPAGWVYVEFKVPESSLKPKSAGQMLIPGPNSPFGRLAAQKGLPIPQFPSVSDLVIKQDVPPVGGGTKLPGGPKGGKGGGGNRGGGTQSDGSGGKPSTGGNAPTSGGGSQTTSTPVATPASPIDLKTSQTVLSNAKNVYNQAKDGKADVKTVQRDHTALDKDLETKAKQLQTQPEMAKLRNANAKVFYHEVRNTFGNVRTGLTGIGQIALNLANAYQFVEEVRFIFDSKDVGEFLSRSGSVAAKYGKEAVKFNVMAFVTRSKPIAAALMILLETKDESPKDIRKRALQRQVAKVVNKVRPGSVFMVDDHQQEVHPNGADGEKLFNMAYKQAIEMRIDYVSKEAKDIGYKDGLTGSKTKTKFVVSQPDREDLEINDNWLKLMYFGGHEQGKRQKDVALKRAEQSGLKDGQDGKPSNFEAVRQWPELQAIIKRPTSTLSSDDIHSGQVVYNEYERNYNWGYAKGEKAGKVLVLDKLEISPNGFTMGAHTNRQLTVTGTFTNKSMKVMTGDVQWRSSNENAVKVSAANGVVHAFLGKPGNADVTASYKGVHGAKDTTISVSVNMPTLRIHPENPKMKVGQKLQFRADSFDKADDPSIMKLSGLDSSLISWATDNKSIVEIDVNGNATIKSAGLPVKIFASYANTPVQVSTTITTQ